MDIQTRKAKGRRFQQWLANQFNDIFSTTTFKSTSISSPGTDVDDPRGLLPWNYTEAKNWEAWPSVDVVDHMMAAKDASGTVVFLTRNRRKEPLVVMPWCVLKRLLVNNKE